MTTPTFLVLTRKGPGTTILLNLDHIVGISPEDGYTRVSATDGEWYSVNETVNEIADTIYAIGNGDEI